MKKLLEHTRRSDITFCHSGRILITARVSRMLSLRPGSTINIASHNGEYFLFATHHDNARCRHIARCYPTNKNGSNYCANSVHLCRTLLTSINVTTSKASFVVGEAVIQNGNVYVPIITRSPLYK